MEGCYYLLVVCCKFPKGLLLISSGLLLIAGGLLLIPRVLLLIASGCFYFLVVAANS